MISLRFDGPDAVRAVLPMVPAEVQARGGRVALEPDGVLSIEVPSLPESVLETLVDAGVSHGSSAAEGSRPFVHWAELVPTEPVAELDLREILFVLPPGAGWVPLAAELVRLGCDDQRLARIRPSPDAPVQWAIRAQRAPFYTVAKATAEGPWTAYAQHFGRDVWVCVGFGHPHAASVEVPEGSLLLIDNHRWSVVSAPTWHELTDHLDLVVEAPEILEPQPPTERLEVQLRLIPTPPREAPSLWIVPEPVDDVLRKLVHRLPDAVVDRLELARFTSRGDQSGAVIRARPGTAPPTLVELVPMVPHPHLPAIFLPQGQTVDPPLQPHTLRRVLDPGLGRVGWLDPVQRTDGSSGFVMRILEDEAFRLLSDLVLYLAEQEADQVDAWLASTRFEWEPLDLEVAQTPATQTRPAHSPRRRPQQPQLAPAPAPAPDPEWTRRVRRRAAVVPVPEAAPAPPDVAQIELQELQGFFLEDPTRDDLWAPMGEMHNALGQGREAAICWSRALWVAEGTHRGELATAWAARCPDLDELPQHPSVDTVATVVARTLAEDDLAEPQQLQDWLTNHDNLLDVRSRWLVRRAVAQRCGDDELALARARDAVLSSIGSGLVPSRDVPAFLRSSASPEDRYALGQSLGALQEALIPLAPEGEARRYTQAYARLTLAWAHALLGHAEPVQEAIAIAEEDLPHDDELHSVLLGLYRAGLSNALSGLPAEAPPPREVTEAVEALDSFPKFKVDRLRSQSVAVIREPGASDPFIAYVQAEDEELTALPADQLLSGLQQALQDVDEAEPAGALLRVIRGMVGLSPADAHGILRAVIERALPLDRAQRVQVLVPAVSVAAALHRPDQAERTLPALEDGMRGLLLTNPMQAAAAARDLGRSLARCRLGAASTMMFGTLRAACPTDQPDLRLSLAATHAMLGGDVSGEAQAALELLEGELTDLERVGVVAAAADLATSMSLSDAVGFWRQLAPQAGRLPDKLSTNSHFALLYLRVVEVLAAAHVHPDRLISEDRRAWLDADEQRVRMRIHQEDRF